MAKYMNKLTRHGSSSEQGRTYKAGTDLDTWQESLHGHGSSLRNIQDSRHIGT